MEDVSPKGVSQSKLPSGHRLQYFEEVTSTNEIALSYIEAIHDNTSFSPVWIEAAQQTAGRGTKGRVWQSSDSKNLYCSFLFYPDSSMQSLTQLSLIAGVALFDAVTSFLKPSDDMDNLTLKWPNDLFVGKAKIAGILVETQKNALFPAYFAVIGTGLNLQSAPKLVDRNTICLQELGLDISPKAALEKLAYFTQLWVSRWSHGQNFSDIADAWMMRANILNKVVLLKTIKNHLLKGRCLGVSNAGQLRINLRQEDVIEIDFMEIVSIRYLHL